MLGVATAAPGHATDFDLGVQASELRRALARLEAREDAKHVAGALEQARRALDTASAATERAAVVRAQAIARAATILAERQLERRRAQAAFIVAEQRLDEIRARAHAQRRVLEALMRDRASLAREMEQP